MRTFYEEWKMLDSVGQNEKIAENVSDNLELTNSKTEKTAIKLIWNLQVPNYQDFPMDAFLHIGFTHHRVILGKIKNFEERLFYLTTSGTKNSSVSQK